jgi:hypothetical protein
VRTCKSRKRMAFGCRAVPNYFIDVIPALPTEHRVEHQFQIVRGGRVAVEVEAAGGFEHAVDFDDAQRHVDEIGEQAPALEHFFEAADQLDGLFGELAILQLRNVSDPRDPVRCFVAPFPGIDKRLRLRPVFAALIVINLEVIALRIEWRVDVAEIDACIGYLAAQDVQVVAVIELVFALWAGILMCCAVLCCAVLCCAVLCCAVLCCAVLCCAVALPKPVPSFFPVPFSNLMA